MQPMPGYRNNNDCTYHLSTDPDTETKDSPETETKKRIRETVSSCAKKSKKSQTSNEALGSKKDVRLRVSKRYNQQTAKTMAELSAAVVQGVQNSPVPEPARQTSVVAKRAKPFVCQEQKPQDPVTKPEAASVSSSSAKSNNAQAYLQVVKATRLEGYLQRAEQHAEEGLRVCVSMSTNERAYLLVELMGIKIQLKQWAEVGAAEQAALALLPELSAQMQVKLYKELTLNNRTQEKYNEAAAMAKAGLALRPNNEIKVSLYAELVEAHTRLNEFDKAVEAAKAGLQVNFLKADRSNEDNYKETKITLYVKLAQLELRRGNYAEAALASMEGLKFHAPSQNPTETARRNSSGLASYMRRAKDAHLDCYLLIAATLMPKRRTRHVTRILATWGKSTPAPEEIRSFAEDFRSASKGAIALIAMEQAGLTFPSLQSADQSRPNIPVDAKVGTLYATLAEAKFWQHHFVEAAVSAQIALHFLPPGNQMEVRVASLLHESETLQSNMSCADAEREADLPSVDPSRSCEMQAVFYKDLAENQLSYHRRHDDPAGPNHPNSLEQVAVTVMNGLSLSSAEPSNQLSNQTRADLYALLTKVRIKQKAWKSVAIAANTGLDPLPSGPVQAVFYAALAEATRELAMLDLAAKHEDVAAKGFRKAIVEALKGLSIKNLPRNELLQLNSEILLSVTRLKSYYDKEEDLEGLTFCEKIGGQALAASQELQKARVKAFLEDFNV